MTCDDSNLIADLEQIRGREEENLRAYEEIRARSDINLPELATLAERSRANLEELKKITEQAGRETNSKKGERSK